MKCFGGALCVWRCVLVSWLLSAIVAIPQSVVSVQTENHILSSDTMQNITIYKCVSSGYTAEWQRKLYFTFMALSLLVIPACIMIYCYASIVRAVWLRAGPEAASSTREPRVHFVSSRRSEAASDQADYHAEIRRPDHESSPHMPRCHSVPLNSHVVVGVPRRLTLTTKRSVMRMAISVTVGFMVCWTPFFVVSSVDIYSENQYAWTAAKSISGLMALSHSAVNPFLYIIFSTQAVRAAFAHLCQRAKPRCCQRQ